ncbi:MAG: cytidine deaminase [Mariniphaga sp.]|nr:cytidine deaminase [Mariniphaga sp.]
MRTKELRILVYEYASEQELAQADKQLVQSARRAASGAYAPYSHFCVGASLLLANGEVISGNNQENAAFPAGLCAERVALFYAQAQFPDVPVTALAVTAKNEQGFIVEPVKPCGSCRQALVESEYRFNQPIRLILAGETRIEVFEGVETLLPFAFKPGSQG